MREIISLNRPKGKNKKEENRCPKTKFKDVIYLPLPFCRKMLFFTPPPPTNAIYDLFFAKQKAQVDHKLPLLKVTIYDLPGLFCGLFCLGLFVCVVVVVVTLLFLLLLLLLFGCCCCCMFCCFVLFLLWFLLCCCLLLFLFAPQHPKNKNMFFSAFSFSFLSLSSFLSFFLSFLLSCLSFPSFLLPFYFPSLCFQV